MAGLRPPALERLESERFRVLPLWNWSLAAARLVTNGGVLVGMGFDPSRRQARLNARSEALERYVYDVWRRTGVSPFTDEPCQAPPPAGGFAAHPDRAQAELRAFLEWRERAALAAAADGRFALLSAAIPDMGLLLAPALLHIRCTLKTFLSPGPPFVAFALGELDPPGAVFGSACRLNGEEAMKAAVAECLRKTAFLHQWREGPETSDLFLRSVRFWISKDGLRAASNFTRKAAAASTDMAELPREPASEYLRTLRLGDLWVCQYWDPRFALPDVGGTFIPLV